MTGATPITQVNLSAVALLMILATEGHQVSRRGDQLFISNRRNIHELLVPLIRKHKAEILSIAADVGQ